ncbi:MAG: Glycosyl transferase, group 1 [Oceanicaulis sp. HLUCCA04]|nr:MAG: Glycosyl transferase, group 1 [Oceanicaulis sp. HLUCCA04]
MDGSWARDAGFPKMTCAKLHDATHATGGKKTKPTILVFSRYYLPGYKAGGPIQSIANLVEALGDEFDFRIVTSDRDSTDTEAYPNIPTPGNWAPLGKAQVSYLPPGANGLACIVDILRHTPHDTLYLNSFFDPKFTTLPLLARRLGLTPKARCVLAPRGEFSAGAMRLKSIKKSGFIIGSRLAGIHKHLTWHASTELERADIFKALNSTKLEARIAMNLSHSQEVELPEFEARQISDPIRICFLSRISPKKNLDFALSVLTRTECKVVFDIFGEINDHLYWNHCKKLLSSLPNNITASYHRSVKHSEVISTISKYDLFFLPTHGENYGHAIVEAFIAGTPVLISDSTPWRNLEALGVGKDISLERPDLFVNFIESLARLDADEQAMMRKRALTFGKKIASDASAIAMNRALFGASQR